MIGPQTLIQQQRTNRVMSGLVTNWIFVVNDKQGEPTAQTFYDQLEEIYTKNKKTLKYICGQLEQGTKKHFQGYLQLQRTQRMSWLKKNIHPTAKFIAQSSSVNDKARHYTMKPMDDCTCEPCTFEREKPTRIEEYEWLEFGAYTKGVGFKNGNQGQRIDIEIFRESIKEGLSDEELWEKHPLEMCKFPMMPNKVRLAYGKHRIRDVVIELRYGHPGKGKTETLLRDYGEHIWIESFAEDVWYDNWHTSMKVACFDEFNGRKSKLGLSSFLTLTDRVVKRKRIKNSFVWFDPEAIVITSNTHPRLWYNYHDRMGEGECMIRRITRVLYYSPECEYGEPHELTQHEMKDFWDHPEHWGVAPEQLFEMSDSRSYSSN